MKISMSQWTMVACVFAILIASYMNCAHKNVLETTSSPTASPTASSSKTCDELPMVTNLVPLPETDKQITVGFQVKCDGITPYYTYEWLFEEQKHKQHSVKIVTKDYTAIKNFLEKAIDKRTFADTREPQSLKISDQDIKYFTDAILPMLNRAEGESKEIKIRTQKEAEDLWVYHLLQE